MLPVKGILLMSAVAFYCMLTANVNGAMWRWFAVVLSIIFHDMNSICIQVAQLKKKKIDIPHQLLNSTEPLFVSSLV